MSIVSMIEEKRLAMLQNLNIDPNYILMSKALANQLVNEVMIGEFCSPDPSNGWKKINNGTYKGMLIKVVESGELEHLDLYKIC